MKRREAHADASASESGIDLCTCDRPRATPQCGEAKAVNDGGSYDRKVDMHRTAGVCFDAAQRGVEVLDDINAREVATICQTEEQWRERSGCGYDGIGDMGDHAGDAGHSVQENLEGERGVAARTSKSIAPSLDRQCTSSSLASHSAVARGTTCRSSPTATTPTQAHTNGAARTCPRNT